MGIRLDWISLFVGKKNLVYCWRFIIILISECIIDLCLSLLKMKFMLNFRFKNWLKMVKMLYVYYDLVL